MTMVHIEAVIVEKLEQIQKNGNDFENIDEYLKNIFKPLYLT